MPLAGWGPSAKSPSGPVGAQLTSRALPLLWQHLCSVCFSTVLPSPPGGRGTVTLSSALARSQFPPLAHHSASGRGCGGWAGPGLAPRKPCQHYLWAVLFLVCPGSASCLLRSAPTGSLVLHLLLLHHSTHCGGEGWPPTQDICSRNATEAGTRVSHPSSSRPLLPKNAQIGEETQKI